MSILEHLQLMLEASALGKNFFEQKYKNSPNYNKVNELVNKEFTNKLQVMIANDRKVYTIPFYDYRQHNIPAIKVVGVLEIKVDKPVEPKVEEVKQEDKIIDSLVNNPNLEKEIKLIKPAGRPVGSKTKKRGRPKGAKGKKEKKEIDQKYELS